MLSNGSLFIMFGAYWLYKKYKAANADAAA